MQRSLKFLNYKLMGDIQKFMEKPSACPNLVHEITSALPDIMPWIREDINNRDLFIAFMLENEINFFYQQELNLSLKLLQHVCRFDHIHYLKKSLVFFIEIYSKQEKKIQDVIQQLFEFSVENHYLRLVVEHFIFENVTIANFSFAEKVAEIVSGIGNHEAITQFLTKIASFSQAEKESLVKHCLLPYAFNLSSLSHRYSIAAYHPTLLAVYKTADQNYHQDTIHYQAASIAIRLRQRMFTFNNAEINRIGQWRRRLAIINKTPHVEKFATKRTEIGSSTTIAKNVYAGLPQLMMQISDHDKPYIIADNDLSVRKGAIRITICYPGLNQKMIPLSRLHLDYDEPSSSMVEHCPPSSFRELTACINETINEIKNIKIDEGSELNMTAVIQLIAKFQWLYAQGTFMQRGDGTNNEVITLGLFIYHKLSMGNFKEIPYYHAYATPRLEKFQENYHQFFDKLPYRINENEFNYDELLGAKSLPMMRR